MKKIIIFILFATIIGSTSAQTVADSTKVSILEHVENWYADNMNYATITALMAVESSFIPFPSEIVIPPAAYVAGIEGSSLNKTDNYLLAMWLGRPIIYAFADSKLGKICLLSSEKVKKAEDYFNEHGNISTFIGRLITVIRQLISIPAGLCKMHFGWFLFYTFLGAGIWNVVLALLGYIAHGQMDIIHEYSHELSIGGIALVGIILLYFIAKAIIKRKK